MSSTHSALYFHLVIGTKHHLKTMDGMWRYRLHAYLGGLVRRAGGVALAVNGAEDHVHLLVSLKPRHYLPDFLRDIKRASSLWAHRELGRRDFWWQEGYSAFTVSTWIVPVIKRYIERQEEHHQVRSFRSEYIALLKRHGVEFDPDSLWG